MKALACPHSPRRSGPAHIAPRGFTLVELMVALVVASILASVAVPSFLAKLRQARRADALDITTQVAHAQERWRANNLSYAAQLVTDLGFGSSTSPNAYYTLTLASATGTGYTLTATAASGKSQTGDTGCTTLVMTVTNGNAAYTPAACWSR
jgi:type IV pilus assembly protein PilE